MRARVCWHAACYGLRGSPWETPVFLFFSNRIGCLGSLLVSVLATLLLLWLFGWL